MHRFIVPFAAATVAMLFPHIASAQAFPDRHATGFIWWVDHGAITLQNRRTVFLKHGTRIEPRGQRLQPGQRIAVQGEDAANGNIDASAIRILGKQFATRAYGSWYGGRDDLVPAAPRTIKQAHRPEARQKTRS